MHALRSPPTMPYGIQVLDTQEKSFGGSCFFTRIVCPWYIYQYKSIVANSGRIQDKMRSHVASIYLHDKRVHYCCITAPQTRKDGDDFPSLLLHYTRSIGLCWDVGMTACCDGIPWGRLGLYTAGQDAGQKVNSPSVLHRQHRRQPPCQSTYCTPHIMYRQHTYLDE